ncbi:endonuclease/exonuclease/phosphatase family protein [Marinoscillum furvescens]|uniref:Endonuclease/exonuclease/phosphatase family metal-dependent hydrolase n=1 Tax=Marinoscillum furvescens DSM 4134 TaxID=1122208 RepID=A0A3D9KXQ0_MARFU|nr:endonuclease/exonuclease/phosphatase family protein [Marinoscillum furvescens]RED93878.1 endonuclease/exonuclease/phosphatase family metal-dependent hydrolase [Marinoscillum furvescens DSM 4134]
MKLLFISIVFVSVLLIILGVIWASGPAERITAPNRLQEYPAIQRLESKDTFSVLTYNVGYFSGMTNNLPLERSEAFFKENLESGLKTLWTIKPDILGLQEVDFGSSRSFNYNQQDTIAVRLGYKYAYQSINWNKRYVPFPYWPPSLQFGRLLSGQSIISHYQINPIHTITLQRPENQHFFRDKFYIDRLLQIAEVKLGNHLVVVMNVHMEAYDQATRVDQAAQVLEVYEKYASSSPVLLIGDFNSAFDSEDAMELIMKGSHIASALLPDQSNHTYSSLKPEEQIDHILYNSNFIEKVSAEVVSTAGQVSDHLPVVMNFKFVK